METVNNATAFSEEEMKAFILKYGYDNYENATQHAEWSDKEDCYIIPSKRGMTLKDRLIARHLLDNVGLTDEDFGLNGDTLLKKPKNTHTSKQINNPSPEQKIQLLKTAAHNALVTLQAIQITYKDKSIAAATIKELKAAIKAAE